MNKALKFDLAKLKARAFNRAEWAEGVLRRYHAAIQNLNDGILQPVWSATWPKASLFIQAVTRRLFRCSAFLGQIGCISAVWRVHGI